MRVAAIEEAHVEGGPPEAMGLSPEQFVSDAAIAMRASERRNKDTSPFS